MTAESSCESFAGLVPTAVQSSAAVVVENEQMAQDTWRIRVECPEIAKQILPGQFFMVRDPKLTDPMLGRPFALLDTWTDASGEPAGVEFGYLVVGKMTRHMTTWNSGDLCSLWGPLGNGFPVTDARNPLLVAGGIGQTPFVAVGRELLGKARYGGPDREVAAAPESVRLCYGVRSKTFLAGVELFQKSGIDVHVSTDDGTFGHHGFVTELVQQAIDGETSPDVIFCCGPEPMMAAVSKIAQAAGIPCWLSLESPMACGFGICFSCVTKVRMDDGSWDYRRTCIEGPVFPAEKLCLECV